MLTALKTAIEFFWSSPSFIACVDMCAAIVTVCNCPVLSTLVCLYKLSKSRQREQHTAVQLFKLNVCVHNTYSASIVHHWKVAEALFLCLGDPCWSYVEVLIKHCQVCITMPKLTRILGDKRFCLTCVELSELCSNQVTESDKWSSFLTHQKDPILFSIYTITCLTHSNTLFYPFA